MLTIEKNKIEELLKKLKEKSDVIDVRSDVLPFKQYLLPAIEETFTYDKASKKISAAKKLKPFILFGLSLRDCEALVQLDEIMKRPNEDFFYFQKRNAATIISLVEEDGHLPHIGIDLILEKLNPKIYKALPISKKGRQIVKSKLFQEKNPKIKNQINPKKRAVELRDLLLDPELLKDAVEWSWKKMPEIWDKLGKQCLGCGICTYVCPLCYCFSIEDKCGLAGKKCSKTRKWDACTLPNFAKISGGLPAGRHGHNFHKTIKERYYNWFYHKFVRAYKEYGKSQCVACGRCKKYCPAKIDIEKILLEIIRDYEKHK